MSLSILPRPNTGQQSPITTGPLRRAHLTALLAKSLLLGGECFPKRPVGCVVDQALHSTQPKRALVRRPWISMARLCAASRSPRSLIHRALCMSSQLWSTGSQSSASISGVTISKPSAGWPRSTSIAAVAVAAAACSKGSAPSDAMSAATALISPLLTRTSTTRYAPRRWLPSAISRDCQ
jgi:hypothetical protein